MQESVPFDRASWDGFRREVPPGSLIGQDGGDCKSGYLLESGLVAATVALDRGPPTCVLLLGPGSLLSPGPVAGPQVGYRAVTATKVVEIPSGLLRQAMRQQRALEAAYLAQLQERLGQAELIAACNAHHSLSARCARWLLRLHEQLGEVIPVTHAFLAAILGVRRAGVTLTLQELQRDGAIHQRRGNIIVQDPARLAVHACSCPNGLAGTDHAVSTTLMGENATVQDRPRVWFEREAKIGLETQVGEDGGWARREAALRLCSSIVTRGQTLLNP